MRIANTGNEVFFITQQQKSFGGFHLSLFSHVYKKMEF